jgi:hypothetical protein
VEEMSIDRVKYVITVFLLVFSVPAYSSDDIPISVPAYSSDDLNIEKLQHKKNSYNLNVDRMPIILKFLFGNELINVHLLNDRDVPNGDVLGIETSEGHIVQLNRSLVKDSTVKARMKKRLLNRLLDSNDARGDFIIALKNGEIEVEGVGFLKRIKLSLTLMLAKLIL